MNNPIKRTENLDLNQRKIKNKKRLSRILVLFITFALISILIISAPAKAFVLNLAVDKTSVTIGGKVVFIASVDINSNENLPIQKLVLKLINQDNNEIILCNFNADGSIIDGCDGINIVKLSVAESSFYGYGYGYGYGDDLNYEITLDTDDYSAGDYSTKLSALIGGNVFSEDGEDLIIKSKSGNNGGSRGIININSEIDNGDTICLNAWKCTEWSKCQDGYQTRTCGQTRSDCLLTPKPAEEKECALQLSSGLTNPVSNYKSGYESGYGFFNQTTETQTNINQENLPDVKMSLIVAVGGIQMLIILLLMAGIVGLLLAIDIVLMIEQSRRARKARRLRRIMYRPKRS